MIVRALPADQVARAEKLLRNLVKRAEKVGLDAPTWTITPVDVDLVDIHITMPTLTLDERRRYTLVGRVEHQGKDALGQVHNIVHSAPGQELPTRFRSSEHGICDHCGVFRYRKTTLAVADAENPGEILALGTGCVEPYLGGSLGRLALQRANVLERALTVARDMATWKPRTPSTKIDTVTFLAAVVTLVRIEGYVGSKLQRARGDEFTGDRALRAIYDETILEHQHEDDLAVALVVDDWLKEQSHGDISERLSNIKTSAAFENIDPTQVRLLADGVAMFFYQHKHPFAAPAERLDGPVRPGPQIPLAEALVAPSTPDLDPAVRPSLGAQVSLQGRLVACTRCRTTRRFPGPRTFISIRPTGVEYDITAFVNVDLRADGFDRGTSVVLSGRVVEHDIYNGRRQARLGDVRIDPAPAAG